MKKSVPKIADAEPKKIAKVDNLKLLRISKTIMPLSELIITLNIFEKLKAVFFVKRFEGNKDYKYRYKDAIPWGGTRMKVKFSDGEVMIGYTQHHQIIDEGFYLTPADIKGNNSRVFIVKSSTEQVSYL